MAAYYNEWDPYAAQWLRNLIAAGLMPDGDVDERSIIDVRGSDLDGYTQCHFFCGIGGWPYALQLAGWAEENPCWSGSCPCQPFSAAGKGKGEQDERHLWPYFRELIAERQPATVFGEQVASKAGRRWLDGVRADLEALAYEVGAADLCSAGAGAPHIRQRLFWVGNATGQQAGSPGFPRRQSDADSRLGYADVPGSQGWGGRSIERSSELPSGTAGAACRLADADGREPGNGNIQRGREHGFQSKDGRVAGWLGNANGAGRETQRNISSGDVARSGQSENAGPWTNYDIVSCADGKSRRVESGTFPLASGVPARMGKLRAYGNAITPQIAAEFVMAYMELEKAA